MAAPHGLILLLGIRQRSHGPAGEVRGQRPRAGRTLLLGARLAETGPRVPPSPPGPPCPSCSIPGEAVCSLQQSFGGSLPGEAGGRTPSAGLPWSCRSPAHPSCRACSPSTLKPRSPRFSPKLGTLTPTCVHCLQG